MIRAFGYVRVSKEEENPENQKIAILEFAKLNGIDVVKIFEDVDVSGSEPILSRPSFKKLLDIANELNIKNVIVFDISRLGRDIFDVVSTMKFLMENGYNIIFVKHPELNFGSDTPVAQAMKKAVLALLATFAEMERAFIRERTKIGIERARKQGKRVGRPPYPLPLEEIQTMLKQGYTLKAIHRYLVLNKKICRNDKCMSYDYFVWKLKKLREKALNE